MIRAFKRWQTNRAIKFYTEIRFYLPSASSRFGLLKEVIFYKGDSPHFQHL